MNAWLLIGGKEANVVKPLSDTDEDRLENPWVLVTLTLGVLALPFVGLWTIYLLSPFIPKIGW